MTDSEQAPPLIPCRRVAIFLSAFAPTDVFGLEATIPERQISFGDLGAVGVLVDRAWRWYHPAWAQIVVSGPVHLPLDTPSQIEPMPPWKPHPT